MKDSDLSVNERIKKISEIFYSGNITSMAKSTFISRTTINSIIGEKQVSPGYDVIRRILEAPPLKDLSSDWLITGNGPMLKTDHPSTVQQSGRNANYQGTFTEPINTIMGSGNSIGGTARERIAEIKGQKLTQAKTEAIELKHENERLKAEIEHLKVTIELQKSFIEEKERMIKILLEKK